MIALRPNPQAPSGGDRRYGFSLVEVVLALGIMAFAVVGIIGILPVALKAGRESLEDSRSAFIAQTIFSNLQETPLAEARPMTGTASEPAVNLSGASGKAYFTFDREGKPLGGIDEAQFESGVDGEDVGFIVYLESWGQSGTPGPHRLAQVLVSVQTPPPASAENRTRYNYTSLIAE